MSERVCCFYPLFNIHAKEYWYSSEGSLSEFMRTMTRSHRRYASEFCFYGFRKEFVILTFEYRKFPRNFVTGKHYETFSLEL